MIVFAGTCTRCEENHTWDDLTQPLSCLEAKNNGEFGGCSRGVFVEEHGFDQECDRCADMDEGIADLEESELLDGDLTLVEDTLGKRKAEEPEMAGSGKKKQKV